MLPFPLIYDNNVPNHVALDTMGDHRCVALAPFADWPAAKLLLAAVVRGRFGAVSRSEAARRRQPIKSRLMVLKPARGFLWRLLRGRERAASCPSGQPRHYPAQGNRTTGTPARGKTTIFIKHAGCFLIRFSL